MNVSVNAGVYLIRGSDRFLVDQAREEVIKSITREDRASAYVKYFSAKTVNLDDIIEICRTRPIISRKVIIVLDDVEKSRRDGLKKLVQYVGKPSPNARLILLWNDVKGNGELEQAVKSGGGQVITPVALKPSQLPAWVRQRVKLKGKRITHGAVEILIELAGHDLSVLNGDIEKLVLFVSDKEEITEDDVLNVSDRKVSYGIFDLADKIGDRKGAEALEILRNLMDAGESATALVSLIARHFRLLWQVKDYVAENYDSRTIARELNLPLFVVEKLRDQSQKFSGKALRRIHAMLYSADRDIKSLGIPPVYLIERVVIESLCSDETKEKRARAFVKQVVP
ncbi:DNA polymerase III subunit delta [Thermodesulforhabdus norvegica]|uniref:DNA polymerase III subunit delta n=1 Tax=Thermodesulforhabdus norvegica TaxID=39841 RepID=A0A1I4TRD2_9BACT|nr:DNA polymerase III subunit delta [Thermodesulforhabdus norvegica]SFM79181.1 DNA polymerase III, delta subunit [Thermodesulforhabdus norvegica]